MKARYLYSELSSAIQARRNCEESGNTEWFDKWTEQIRWIEKNLLPSGSGIDSGTHVDLDSSHAEKIVLLTSYHHMNEGGFYAGWTEHTVTVTPSFTGIHIRVSGRDRNDIKDYLHEQFDCAMCQLVEHVENGTYKLVNQEEN